jgi:hypothetical protein
VVAVAGVTGLVATQQLTHQAGQVTFLPGPVRISAQELQPGTQLQPGAVISLDGHATGFVDQATVQIWVIRVTL